MSRHDSRTDIALYRSQMMDGWMAEVEGHAPQEQQSMWALIDDRLRGRWLWMFALGAILAAVFAVMGFRSSAPMYLSQGAIRIAPSLNRTLYPIEETGQLPHYQSFLNTHIEYIGGRRVLEHALENESVKALPWYSQPNPLAALENGLQIISPNRGELIFIGFEASERAVAQTVCKAIIESYYSIYGQQVGQQTNENLQQLSDYKGQLERSLRATQSDIQNVYTRHRTTDPRALHATKAERLDILEQKLAAARLALERKEAIGTGEGAENVDLPAPALQQLEAINPRLSELRQQRDRAIDALEVARSRFRPSHSEFRKAQRWLETAERLFQAEYERTLGQWEHSGMELVTAEAAEGFFDSLPLPRLRVEVQILDERMEALRTELDQLIADIAFLAEKEFEAERTREDLTHVTGRMDALGFESDEIASRITVVQDAAWPHSPHKDSRKRRAAAGLVFGFCVSFGAFFLLGTFDRRTYGTGQLRSAGSGRTPKCLGVLPDLGRSLRDSESGDVASHCVHQIRNQIEVLRDHGHGYVLTVSSPFQGDGKTSIVMALGWSYAAAGYRTVLVDCDLVGRSLTRQLGMIGRDGLKEALLRRHCNGALSPLPVEHLSVLPVGVDPHFGPETLRQVDLQTIFDLLRDQFEMIIIDTGPLLGSLESTPVTASADGVVLSMRRGRSRTRLEECVRRLDAAGAHCLGVILNCVGRGECSRYVSDASLVAAEVERHGAAGEADAHSIVLQAANGEQNILMAAMESSSRLRDQDEP